ncbi:MAG: 23S rRNA (adenine(2503)-C(2))-methyltransferase RlmN [Gemmatimonadales bacterium]|nr:MAG: 23S rRNA (adenine(2503)-C(2))-methyltransferase RlmN [Gemmatimonadales bacterium]
MHEGPHVPNVMAAQIGSKSRSEHGLGRFTLVGSSGLHADISYSSMPNRSPCTSSAPETLLDLTPSAARGALAEWVTARELPRYRVDQLVARLWQRPVGSWREATELPAALRAELDNVFPLPHLEVATVQVSADGTRKYLWRLRDGEAIESVLIPSGKRRTLCVSSQAGCALGCIFCATGRMGFRRHLTPFEIVGQVRELVLKDVSDKPTNVVFMGMGEPLLNWPAVDRALTILNHPEGLGIGARHITVSTVGILPAMRQLAARPEQFRLAISLHAPSHERRRRLMPIEQKYDLDAVLRTAKAFARRVTPEYVLIAGANDTIEDADLLARHAGQLGALVNLLPLHPGGDPDLSPTAPSRIKTFADRLRNQGVEAVVRRSRGLDIDAACGQLRVRADQSAGMTPDR